MIPSPVSRTSASSTVAVTGSIRPDSSSVGLGLNLVVFGVVALVVMKWVR